MVIEEELIEAAAKRLTSVPADQKVYVERIKMLLLEVTEKEFTVQGIIGRLCSVQGFGWGAKSKETRRE